jgi:hypothetical protein
MTTAHQPTTATPATARLLWALSRPDPELDAISRARDGADLDELAAYAFMNRVGPLCWRSLGMAGLRDQLGQPSAELLSREANLWRVHAQILVPRTLELALKPLIAQGHEPVVFKGPALAARYPASGLRPMDDIDLILPHADHQRALAALLEVGWRRVEGRPGLNEYDSYLVHDESPGLPLELHWDLQTWRERAHGLSGIDLWHARTPTTVYGCEAFSIPREEELIALASHAGKPYHHFGRLIWSVDIAVVLNGGPLDWNRVAALARRWKCKTVLAVALVHARRLGADVPDELLQLSGGRARRAALAHVLDERWPVAPPDRTVVHQLRYALWDSPVRKAGLLVGEASTSQVGTKRSPARAAAEAFHLAWLAFKRWRVVRRGEVGKNDPPDDAAGE